MLDHLVKPDLHKFQELWRKRAKDRRTILDWGTTDTNKVRPKKGTEAEAVSRIRIKPHQVIVKHYAINLQSKLARQDVQSGVIAVPGADIEFPDYDQKICCSGCYSGCVPVAWAQVFGYFDRLASPLSPVYDSRFSASIYGENGDNNVRAPMVLTTTVQTLVEEIRQQVQTFCCSDGVSGCTYSSSSQFILSWFQQRQGPLANLVSNWEGSANELRNLAKRGLNAGYPVVMEFLLGGPGTGHAVVATKYRTRSKKVQECHWNNQVPCNWVTIQEDEFYLHYGWGGNNNQWQTLEPFGVHIAYLSP